MNSEANKTVVKRYMERWNTGNVVLANEVLTPTWVDHTHPEVRDPESVKQAVPRRNRLTSHVVCAPHRWEDGRNVDWPRDTQINFFAWCEGFTAEDPSLCAHSPLSGDHAKSSASRLGFCMVS
jgi:hypothetical protein